MKPFINIDEIEAFETYEKGPYAEKCAGLSDKIGAEKLSYSVTILQPGKKVCPFHNHRINEEMFMVLDGTGTLRFGDKTFSIKKNDIISCPPGGQDVAHQIINTSDKELKYLCLSTNEPYDICEYPDSQKVMSMAGSAGNRKFKHISKLDQEVDYFEGEI